MREDAILQLEGRVGRVLRRAVIWFAVLIPAARDVRRAMATDPPHRAEGVIEQITPMRQHIHNDAAAVSLAVIPGGPLRPLQIAFENVIAKLAAHGKDPAE